MASSSSPAGFAPVLPGSNNQHTVGRSVDTYDREFGGEFGSGCFEATDQQETSLRQAGELTTSGYHQDGFVVGDGELEEGEVLEGDDDDGDDLDTTEVLVDRVRGSNGDHQPTAQDADEAELGEEEEVVEEEVEEDDDDSDYDPDDDGQDWDDSQGPDSLS